MDPSIPNEPDVERGRSIPRSRPAENEVLEGEIIDKGAPLGRPRTGPPPPPGATPQKPRNRRQVVRTILWTLLGVVVFGCLGGGVAAWVLYNKAAEPDRGNPTATLRQYLDARFNKRDVPRANVFTCAKPDLVAVDEALAKVQELEVKFDIKVTMFTSNMVITTQLDDQAQIRVRINLEIPEENGQKSVQVQEWQFGAVRANDWRICSALELG